jgi:3-phenylpropionate/trans-cinnamate dioxygenase ferredoxin reductase subunit
MNLKKGIGMAGMVIIGAGQAAGQAAASMRQEGYDGEILVLGDEPHPPYQRPPLSKQYLSGELGIERLYLRPEKFYGEKAIDLRTGVRVTGLDVATRCLVTSTGESHDYTKLLIATGSRPRLLTIPGSDLGGIHYLRTIADVDGIQAEMVAGRKLVIVGGGYIGLEVASVAVTAGMEVSVLEMEDRILQRVTTAEMSDFYHQLHTARGVKLLTNTMVTAFGGTQRVTSVNCRDRTVLDADVVIVGIGIVPNVELAQQAGIACDNGIIVDEHCQTSAANVYAAGDCTNHPNPIMGRRLRLESVPNAMEQARVAASNMCGGDKTYAAVPWFWSDQYELKLQMVGFSTDGDTQVIRGDKSINQFAVFYLKAGAIVAVDAVNSPREFMVCKQLYGRQVDASKLSDNSVDLKSLLSS